MRKLKKFRWDTISNLTDKSSSNESVGKFTPADLMISILIDKRLNSTEKAIIGLFIEESLFGIQKYDDGDGNIYEDACFPSEVIAEKNTCIIIADYLTTKEISKILGISMPTVFNNISSLKEKGIISFERYKFGEYAQIGFNIGYLALTYFE